MHLNFDAFHMIWNSELDFPKFMPSIKYLIYVCVCNNIKSKMKLM